MASHSRQQKKLHSRGGQLVSERGPFSSLWRPAVPLGLIYIFGVQTLCAQEPFPLLKQVSDPGSTGVLASVSDNSKLVSIIDNSKRRLASASGIPNIQQAETIREAAEIRMEDAEQKINNASAAQSSPTGAAEDKQPQQKSKDRTGSSSFLPTLKPIGEIDINIATKPKANDSSVPPNLANIDQLSTPVRDSTFAFGGAAMYGISPQRNLVPYQPLYFEEVNLERYGRARCGQCVGSMVRFFGTVPMLPYFMTIHNPNDTMYWNWPYEAGWGAPRVRELPPFSLKAAAVQALAVTGAAAVIP